MQDKCSIPVTVKGNHGTQSNKAQGDSQPTTAITEKRKLILNFWSTHYEKQPHKESSITPDQVHKFFSTMCNPSITLNEFKLLSGYLGITTKLHDNKKQYQMTPKSNLARAWHASATHTATPHARTTPTWLSLMWYYTFSLLYITVYFLDFQHFIYSDSIF